MQERASDARVVTGAHVPVVDAKVPVALVDTATRYPLTVPPSAGAVQMSSTSRLAPVATGVPGGPGSRPVGDWSEALLLPGGASAATGP
ncbi:unannotated protein [freshwater metagenome]|uniref:Unannotated protein n=1 Tax=freshwater metagenome TaxID=449393 RepID=A0A6J7HLU4_9ZZZZ